MTEEQCQHPAGPHRIGRATVTVSMDIGEVGPMTSITSGRTR